MESSKATGDYRQNENSSQSDEISLSNASQSEAQIFEDQLFGGLISEANEAEMEELATVDNNEDAVAEFSTGDMIGELMGEYGAECIHDANMDCPNPTGLEVGVVELELAEDLVNDPSSEATEPLESSTTVDERSEDAPDQEREQDEENNTSDLELTEELIVDSIGLGFGATPEIFSVMPESPEVYKDILMRLEGESQQLSGLTLAEAIYDIGGNLSRTEVYLDPTTSLETASLTEWIQVPEADRSLLHQKLVGLADTYGDNCTVGEMFDQDLLSDQDMIALHSELRTHHLNS